MLTATTAAMGRLIAGSSQGHPVPAIPRPATTTPAEAPDGLPRDRADRVGRKPFGIATFVAFSAFPLAVVASHDAAALTLEFVVGGSREIGEPARKALIVYLSEPHLRARSVGLHSLVRSLAVAPAAVVGGLLWQRSPALPFLAAGAVGRVGTAAFVTTVDERHAG